MARSYQVPLTSSQTLSISRSAQRLADDLQDCDHRHRSHRGGPPRDPGLRQATAKAATFLAAVPRLADRPRPLRCGWSLPTLAAASTPPTTGPCRGATITSSTASMAPCGLNGTTGPCRGATITSASECSPGGGTTPVGNESTQFVVKRPDDPGAHLDCPASQSIMGMPDLPQRGLLPLTQHRPRGTRTAYGLPGRSYSLFGTGLSFCKSRAYDGSTHGPRVGGFVVSSPGASSGSGSLTPQRRGDPASRSPKASCTAARHAASLLFPGGQRRVEPGIIAARLGVSH